MDKTCSPPGPDDWHWREPSPFSLSVGAGDQIFIGGQPSLDSAGRVLHPGSIAEQTREAFENMGRALASRGLAFADLVRLNTYYVFDGPDSEATRYWEDMTRVRLEYFPDPGPAATAVRIKGMPYAGQLIQIEGVALQGESGRTRRRIMPKGSWDWSIAVPLSQGWRVGSRIFVGGQISADERGEPVHVGDLTAQTRNIYRFISRVLQDAGASFEDVVHVKVCFKHDSRDADGAAFVDRIMDVSKEYFGARPPVLTAFGVDLLYPGLDLEIDAMAIADPVRLVNTGAQPQARYQPAEFSESVRAHGEVYVGGQVALSEAGQVQAPCDHAGQARIVFGRVAQQLSLCGVGVDDVVKLNLFIAGDGDDLADAFHAISRVWAETAPGSHPAMTVVRVHELARPGLLVQADCIAVK